MRKQFKGLRQYEEAWGSMRQHEKHFKGLRQSEEACGSMGQHGLVARGILGTALVPWFRGLGAGLVNNV